MAGNRWIELTETNPGHSAWYIETFRSMAANGDDLNGEARFADAMVPRRSRILDAGCGPGRVGAYLAGVGHSVVGVDIDPILIDAAQQCPHRQGSGERFAVVEHRRDWISPGMGGITTFAGVMQPFSSSSSGSRGGWPSRRRDGRSVSWPVIRRRSARRARTLLPG